MTNETEARSALIALHHQICFENGDHPDEVDTVYSTGADAITRADLSDAKDARIAEYEVRLQELEAGEAEATRLMLGSQKRMRQYKARAEAAEAKLAKAVDAFETVEVLGRLHKTKDKQFIKIGLEDCHDIARATLAELKGSE